MDLSDAHAALDAHAARRARIRDLEASSAATRADMAEREALCLVGEEPPEWQVPLKPVRAPAPRAVQQPVATMTPETQAGWDAWVTGHIKIALRKWEKSREGMVDKALVDAIGEALAHDRKVMREHVAAEKAQLLVRVMSLEAALNGRALSRIYPGARHADEHA